MARPPSVSTRRAASMFALARIAYEHRPHFWYGARQHMTGLAHVFPPARHGWLYNEKKEDQIRSFVQAIGLSRPYLEARAAILEQAASSVGVNFDAEIGRQSSLDRPTVLPIYVYDYSAEYAAFMQDGIGVRIDGLGHFGYVTRVEIRLSIQGMVAATRQNSVYLNILIDTRGHSPDSFYGSARHRAEASGSEALLDLSNGLLTEGVPRILRGYGIPYLAVDSAESFDDPSTSIRVGVATAHQLEIAFAAAGWAQLSRVEIGAPHSPLLFFTHPLAQEGAELEGLV